jgi:hypothetical protein
MFSGAALVARAGGKFNGLIFLAPSEILLRLVVARR